MGAIDFDITKRDEKTEKIRANILHSLVTFVVDIKN